MMEVDLSSYNNDWYHPGAGILKRTIWFFVNAVVFSSFLFPVNSLKIVLLKLFGARLGKNVVIKPRVNIKYPWFLEIGDNTWIGEDVWIDNLAQVKIGKNCCLSQGAMILTGNHDYRLSSFDLWLKPVELQDGVWIGAKALVCPGVVCMSHSVLTANSLANKNLQSFSINSGNPALKIKDRIIS